MKILVFTLFCFSTFLVTAAGGSRRIVEDTIQLQLKEINSIINAGEWKPTDSIQFKKVIELIEYLENSPIDSVIVQLKQHLEQDTPILKRNIYQISEADKIEGYIRSWEINNSLINLEKRIISEMPLETIVVPENQFSGMYANLPLISSTNRETLIRDSIIVLPDSIMLLMANAKLNNSSKKTHQSDSIFNTFLENARKIYNNQLIESYRDSVKMNYRMKHRKDYIDSQKKKYTETVSTHNIKILSAYNDSVSNVMNKDFKAKMKSLVIYADRLPNPVNVSNYFNEGVSISLQNDTTWFQWVWLKNAQNDSIGLRIQNIDKHSFRVLVDESVNLSRLSQRQTIDVKKVESMNAIDHRLIKVVTRKPKISPWKLDGKAYSGFTQTYINDYWSKGGKTSASALSTFSYDANYSKKKVKWENGVDAKLGLIFYMPDEGVVTERNWHKNSDNFEINSRFGYSAFKEWYYSADANFKTQFFLGYKNNNEKLPNSSLFSPAYLTFSGGFDYKPNKDFSMFLAPLSVKTTYVSNPDVDETRFGLLEGQTQKTRIGMAGKLEYKKVLTDDISLKTKNSIFVNFGVDNEGVWQFIKIPDFDSETTIDFKVNQFISTQINFHFIYDKDVESKWKDTDGVDQNGTRLQIKEFFTLGFSYKF